MPVFEALKPEGDSGFVHAGAVGAGHFSKMVHNGIEYGMMQSFAEGWELLEAAPQVTNVREVFRSWTEGTVIRSWLLDLLVRALDDDEHLSGIRGYADDSGEGRWTVEAGIDMAVPTPAITASLYARFTSRQEDSPQMKAVAALRNQFGGHAVQQERLGVSGGLALRVTHLSLADFRSYASLEIALGGGVTAFVGPNGQGKTNLVEAIGYIATLDSHRVATDQPLVRFGAPRAIVRANVEREGRTQLVEIELNPGGANRARLNRNPVPRPREVLGVAADRAVRAGGSGAGEGRSRRAAPVPGRVAGRALAAVRGRACRLRPRSEAAEHFAAHGRHGPA